MISVIEGSIHALLIIGFITVYIAVGFFVARGTVRYESKTLQAKYMLKYPTWYKKESSDWHRYSSTEQSDWERFSAACHLMKTETLPLLFWGTLVAWPAVGPVEVIRKISNRPQEGTSFIGSMVPEIGDEEREEFAEMKTQAMDYQLKAIESKHRDLGLDSSPFRMLED